MSTPVVTSKWAGTFDCGTCRRKRLMGEEFSKKALEKHRKDPSKPLKCKQCVGAAEQAEREQAAARRKQQGPSSKESPKDGEESRPCVGGCGKTLPQSSFNRNQWCKGEGKSRCRDCVERALQEESQQHAQLKEAKIQAARQKLAEATSGGNAAKIVAAESELAALEAEKVTGLKPVKLSSGRGRGRGRGRVGTGRGRSGGRR